MTRIPYINGTWLPKSDAMTSVFDCGFIMADDTCEMPCVLETKLIACAGHAAR